MAVPNALERYVGLLISAAFDAGFGASEDGWNGEHLGDDASTDPDYVAVKEQAISRILEIITPDNDDGGGA